jgi:hypothetical protein
MGNASAGASSVRVATTCLQVATGAVLAYLCVGECLPPLLAHEASTSFSGEAWARQQVLLLAAVSIVLVLLASAGGCSNSAPAASTLLAALNAVPVAAAVAATHWSLRSDNCPVAPYDGAPAGTEVECDYAAVVLDVVGLISARLARLNLGICLILATRGDAGWLLRATGGRLGLPEAVPLHRIAGWWCAVQSALHSISYAAFYLWTGGLRSFWLNCFPAVSPAPDGLNTLGLVNFFGVVAFVAMLPLVIPALPYLRHRAYHIFQLLHLPAAVLFVICCALHDLPILLFALPGIADWYLGWRDTRRATATSRAKLSVLAGTSGPWVELSIDRADTGGDGLQRPLAPRGEWALVRVLSLGKEVHPFSVAVSANGAGLYALIATGAGDWSKQLGTLASKGPTILASSQGGPAITEVAVELTGPFPVGGGDWSLLDEPALLLVAGGTGVLGWLPALAASADSKQAASAPSSSSAAAGRRRVHLVW